jgi:hypothetical protein
VSSVSREVAIETASRRPFDTAREDRWWLPPLASGLGLAAFGVYAFVAAVLSDNYRYTEGGADYLSPFYSPDLSGLDVPFSSAFLVIWVPLGFRATCYYYRKAYYRAYFLSPPACAVTPPRKGRYRGEAAFPYVLMNAHRYFLFLATVVLGFLWYDAIRAFIFDGSFGVGVGSLVLLANAILLSLFTFGCNSVRHLVGGRLDCFNDVLVIGAGGAGLRAAIEASAPGVSVGLVCKSLLGKAHTVMAEGGIAAALANVDDRDNWRSTSPTRCAAASTSTTGAWPSCTPRKRPTACASSRRGARSSTAPRTAASCSATSAATAIRAWRTSATAPASR